MNHLLGFPFLSIGNIFSFSGGAAKKRNTKKRTKVIKKRNAKTLNKTRKKNLSRKVSTRKKINSRRRSINKRTRAKTLKKIPKIYSKKKRSCNCDHSKHYTGKEPSPKGLGFCAHCTPLNVTMKGHDGNLWENQKYSKGKRWVKVRVDMN
tara:strand:- start:3302 stop:3751 length:450 start_codon:yes stop_codon:yes gene_type:complete